MKNKSNYILCLRILIVVSVISYFVGCKITYDKFESDLDNHKVNYQTFYTTITGIENTGLTNDDTALTVKGLDVNDINFRENFELIITEATEIECDILI